MVLRQVLVGVSGGTVLATIGLFLAAPGVFGPGLAFGSSSGERTLQIQRASYESARDESTALDEGTAGRGRRSEAGVRIASIGPVPAVDADVPVIFASGLEENDPAAKGTPAGSAGALSPDELDPDSFVGALSKQTIIRAAPNAKAQVLGYARTGALLRRAQVKAGTSGCPGGWYRVEPSGYVCVGPAATLDLEHPVLRLASVGPDRSRAMPYSYGSSRFPTPPLYTRLPTEEQQRSVEQDLALHKKKNFGSLWADEADTPPPSLLLERALIPRPYGYAKVEGEELMSGRALASSAFAFIDLFESEGRRWGLTADLSLLPLDRVVPVEASKFSGVVLDDEHPLPVAFVRSRAQHVYALDAETLALTVLRPIEFREAFFLTGKEVRAHGSKFLETRDGNYIKDHGLLAHVRLPDKPQKWAKNDRSWLEISVVGQTLVAYQGTKPVFATLVSTGRDGLGDPETTHSTAQGLFLIHTKHVTSTMSGDEADDEFDLRDVPYVQYFHGGFALHAAFWHDGFGQPRSHGCVNLSPSDARHLFSLTDPPVPQRWHSALSREGTLVYVHP